MLDIKRIRQNPEEVRNALLARHNEASLDQLLAQDEERRRLLAQVEEWVQAIAVGKRDCVCIMTRGHKSDLEGQAFALRSPAAYIGVIGSRRKIAETNEKLRALGFTDEQIARIITPIGLSIGAVTPAEIAVSIAAQLIAHRSALR